MGFEQILKYFLHDPIDKCLDIKTHEYRAKEYADILSISGIKEAKGSDQIASCMERSLLPKNVMQGFNEIRHPFSDEKIEIKGIEKDKVFNSVREAFEEIDKEIRNWDDKKKFLYLLRNLIEIVFEKLNGNPLKKYIHLLPADTRIPDHSIWEHLKVTSAINVFEHIQNNSLFLFTLGPVQSFISQARKAQDLFMGSFLISYLTFIAIERFIEDYGPTAIVYPDLHSQPLMDWYLEKKGINVKNSRANLVHYPTIPNRFVAIIPETEPDKIKELAKKLKDRVKDEWETIVRKVLQSFNRALPKDVVNRQITDFPLIYWAAIPWKEATQDIKVNDLKDFIEESEIERWEKLWQFAEENGEFSPNIGFIYQLIYTSLEKSIRMRKNLRDFLQVEEVGIKCSICGEKEQKISADNNLSIGKFISDKERLCIMCFVKRGLEKYLAEKFEVFIDFSFPSTAEVASSDFKIKALENAKDEFKKYIDKFEELTKFQKVNPLPILKELFKDIENLEGEWFFEENITEDTIQKNLGYSPEKEKINELKKYLNSLTEKIGKPNPYYAVIMLDADNMGDWLSGEKLPKIESAYNTDVWENLDKNFKEKLIELSPRKFLTPGIHSAISTALKNYSIEFVRKIVEEEYLGKLVYSGGDDVLAFVNLKDLFDIMRKLRFAFSGEIKINNGNIEVNGSQQSGFVEKDKRWILTMGKDATASMGVVIAHYKMPLRIVLTKARKMLKLAKNEFGKDSFAIALLKHSGDEKIGISKWKYENLDVLEFLKELVDAMDISKKIHLSDKFIYSLHQEFSKLTNKEGNFVGMGEIFDLELRRLLVRSYNEEDKDKKGTFVQKKYKGLSTLFWKCSKKLDNFIGLLSVASFLSKKEKWVLYA